MSQVEHRKAEEVYAKAVQIAKKDPVEALCLFKKAIFLSPEHWKWYYGRANVCMMIGDISSAILNSKKALYLNRGEKKLREQLCLLYDMDGLRDLHNRHIDLALEKFNTCLRYIDPYPPAILHRGTVKLFFKKDQVFDALKDLESCREACVPYVNVILGQHYLLKQDLHKASKELELCMKDFEYVAEVMAFKETFDDVVKEKKLLLRKLVAKRDFMTGKKLADELIGLRPNDNELYFLRGIVLRENSEYTEAVKDFLFCKQQGFEPENSQALLGKCLYSISESRYQTEDYIDCVQYMDECIQWQKNDDERVLVENTYLSEGEGKRRREDRVQCLVLRGDAYLQLQKYEYAIKDYRKAHSIDANEITNQRLSRIHLRWGKILMKNAKLELAEKELTKAITFLKNDCDAYLFRAKCLFSMNDESRVKEAVEDLVAYYLMNNQNERVNKLVYQYIPQIVYSSRIQRHYRKKFGLSLLSSSNTTTTTTTNNNEEKSFMMMNPNKSKRRVKSAYPVLTGNRRRRRRRRKSPQLQRFHASYSQQHSQHIEEKPPLVEFTEENGIKLPELSTFSNNPRLKNNIMNRKSGSKDKPTSKKKKGKSVFITELSMKELRRLTKLKKHKDRQYKLKLKRIRDQAIAPPSQSNLSNPIRRIQDRHKKVLNISSSLNLNMGGEEHNMMDDEYISSEEEEEEEEEEGEEMYSSYTYKKRGKKKKNRNNNNNSNRMMNNSSNIWGSNQEKFEKWRDRQKKFYYQKATRTTTTTSLSSSSGRAGGGARTTNVMGGASNHNNKGRARSGRPGGSSSSSKFLNFRSLKDIGDGRRSVASGSIVHSGMRRTRRRRRGKKGKKKRVIDPLKMVL